MLNKILYFFSKLLLSRNIKFNNIHEGESCYIFGNGPSINYFDLTKFNDKISIGIGAIIFHKDFKKLNLKYYYDGHPFAYSPIWKNPYSKKFELNKMGALYKTEMKNLENVNIFLNLSNAPFFFKKNIYYLHHFGKKFTGFKELNLEKNFTLMQSGLGGMISLAIKLGFKEIILVGCDYCLNPIQNGHFFEKNDYEFSKENKVHYSDFLHNADNEVKIMIIKPFEYQISPIINSISYNEYMKSEIVYKKNIDLISNLHLIKLNKVNFPYKIF